jgi:hypothetical protein
MEKIIREYFEKMGRKGGKSKSPAKVSASRENGLSGGRPTTSSRFWKYVNKNGDCWVWTGDQSHNGYGRFRIQHYHKRSENTNRCKRIAAHKYSFLESGGIINDGMQLDHLCRNRLCVKPEHLECVTPKENINRGMTAESLRARKARITHCPQGHPYDHENTYKRPSREIGRECRACGRQRSIEWNKKKGGQDNGQK